MAKRSLRMRFGGHVRELRLHAGLSQEELAKRARLSRHYISEMESGKRNPSLDVIVRIADGLRIPLSQMMEL